MENILDEYLVKLVQDGGRQAWAGKRPPFEMTALDFQSSTNFRLSSALHQQFDGVWLFETTVNDFSNFSWMVFLDEALRLLGQKGFLVVKADNTDKLSIPWVKSYLGRHLGLKCDVMYETAPSEAHDIIVFSIEREDLEAYRSDEWTFSILTTGGKEDNVCAFLKSVREHDPSDKHEIIVCGPHSERYDEYHVKYIPYEQFENDRYAAISKKKNLIIDMATRSNLMIVHDRFVLSEDFFRGFDEYGYDFDFLTVRQFAENGTEYPSYAMTEKKMIFSGQRQINDYSKLYESTYLNGGLIIMKTHTAREIRFNDMLFWNQMEDVELAQVAMMRGIVPRMNFLSSAITGTVREGYFSSWRVEEPGVDGFASIGDPSLKNFLIHWGATHVPLRLKSSWLYQFLKHHIRH